jgi:hypothetical protein
MFLSFAGNHIFADSNYFEVLTQAELHLTLNKWAIGDIVYRKFTGKNL